MSWLRKASLLCLVLYWALLFLGTHIPGGSMPDMKTNDKIQHWVAFAGLSFLISAAMAGRRAVPGRILMALGVAITYAAIDEWTQGFIPRRHSDFWDWCADAGGALAGAGCFVISYMTLKAAGWIREDQAETDSGLENTDWVSDPASEPA